MLDGTSNGSHYNSEHESQLHAVLADIIQRIEAGQTVDQQKVLAENPDLAADLDEFFRDQEALAKRMSQIRTPPTVRCDETLAHTHARIVKPHYRPRRHHPRHLRLAATLSISAITN